jgi:hypothetical protein
MPAQPRIGGESALEVHAALRLKIFQIRPIKRFLENIERQSVAIAGCRGEATAVDRDAVPDVDSTGKLRGGDFQSFGRTIRAERNNGANFFDEAGEHGSRIAMRAGEASPADRSTEKQERDEDEDRDQHRQSEFKEIAEEAGGL